MSYQANPSITNMVAASIDSWYLRSLGPALYPVASIDTTDDLITLAAGFAPTTGDAYMIEPGIGGVVPTGLAVDTLYYGVNASSQVVKFSATKGGAAIDITTVGTLPLFVRRVDVAYYNLLSLHDGSVTVDPVFREEGHKIPITRGAMLKAKAQIMDTSKVNLLKTLDQLSSNKMSHVINLTGGGSLVSHGLARPFFGLGWKFVCEGDGEKDRYLEISASRRVNRDETNALLTTAAPSYGTPDSADKLYLLASLSAQGSLSAGFEYLALADAFGNVYQEVGSLTGCSLILELITIMNQFGEEEGQLIKVDVAADALQASTTEMAQLAALSAQAHYVKVKLLGDGTIFTFGTASKQQVGVTWSFDGSGDMDKHRMIKYRGAGTMKVSELDAAIA